MFVLSAIKCSIFSPENNTIERQDFMATIHNPILPGFRPDPSICRVGDDYYIATSTFEWFPGVLIHHSRDLVHWQIVAAPLDRVSQLDMIGNPDSCGIWAPCLSHDGKQFYLIYTDLKNADGIYKDAHNYLATAPDVRGPWSEPTYMKSSGFDASLFHDDDGHKWFLNMMWDHRGGHNPFGGILLQEYDHGKKALIGPEKNIFKGTFIKLTEGPHLYKKNGWYYLLVAEGGTFDEHAVTFARSKKIDGPYEVHPHNPILSSYGDRSLELQRAGHASLVETQNGEWYLAHLCGRPLGGNRCTLGRETALQKMRWDDDGWIRLEKGGNRPAVDVPAPNLPAYPLPKDPSRDDFDGDTLPVYFQSLRIPMTEDWMSLKVRKGFLRLFGRESLGSRHHVSLVGRRLTAFKMEIDTCVEFDPKHFQQMAGLSAYYQTLLYHFLYITHDEKIGGTCLNIMTCDRGRFSFSLEEPVSLGGATRVFLGMSVNCERLTFRYSLDGKKWTSIGPKLDMTIISDEHANAMPDRCNGFTGAFATLSCHDLSGSRLHADFDYLDCRED
jgi:xylan 1,4-beta-xylosidase